MDVRDYYEERNQPVDINFMNEILTIIKSDEAFLDTLKCEFVEEKKYGPAFTYHGITYFNVDLFFKCIARTAEQSFQQYPKGGNIKYYNFMALLLILHECSHVWQQKGLEKYAEINKLHYDVSYRKFPLKKILKLVRCQVRASILSAHAYYERQANVDALRELIDMYQGYPFLDFIELQHIYNLSFKAKRESIVHDTLYAYFLEYNYNCDGIPQDLLFEVGFPTNKDYADSVYEAIDKYNNGELSYGKVIEKIKKC